MSVRGPLERVRALLGRHPLPVWYHENYALPLPQAREMVGLEPRRPDLALWALLGSHNRRSLHIHQPARATFADIARVHTTTYVESLTRPLTLSHVFGLDSATFPVDPVLTTLRLAIGGTMAATRTALERGGPTLNLLGGFHHAAPDRGAGFCALNDIAIALATARAEGFQGQALIIDLDAHPPDGTAACLEQDEASWIASLSGVDWGPLPGVDETALPGAEDAEYLAALRALLDRQKKPDLAFVLAGGDVLANDRLGALALTEHGAFRRDRIVAAWLDDVPSVWLPAGGYQSKAWRVVAQTAGALIGRAFRPIPQELDPIASHFAYVSRSLDAEALHGEDAWITQDEIDAMFGAPSNRDHRLLGYYTAEGVEHALWAYGILPVLRRLGYSAFQVVLDKGPSGDRARLTGHAAGSRHLLWEIVVDRDRVADQPVLFVNWMTMRHPLGAHRGGRSLLPGQDAPGLGLADEALGVLTRVCARLELAGVLLRPAWLHVAAMGHPRFRFVDPSVQGEFEALLRDLGHMGLAELSAACTDGRLRRNGEVWTWSPAPMVLWIEPREEDTTAIAAARQDSTFTMGPAADA